MADEQTIDALHERRDAIITTLLVNEPNSYEKYRELNRELAEIDQHLANIGLAALGDYAGGPRAMVSGGEVVELDTTPTYSDDDNIESIPF